MQKIFYVVVALAALLVLGYCSHDAFAQENIVSQSALSAGLFFPNIPGKTNANVTRANIKQTICVDGWTAKIRPPTTYTEPMKKKLMEQAGIPWSQAKSYELDHHVPLEAGGNPSSPQNLALQSYIAKPWNAHVKDKLENFAHVEICHGKMTLDQAQALFVGVDWRIAYCKYFKDAACSTLPH